MRKVIIYAVLAVFLLTGCSGGMDYVSEGTAHLQEHQYEEAAGSFEKAIRLSEQAAGSSKKEEAEKLSLIHI